MMATTHTLVALKMPKMCPVSYKPVRGTSDCFSFYQFIWREIKKLRGKKYYNLLKIFSQRFRSETETISYDEIYTGNINEQTEVFK